MKYFSPLFLSLLCFLPLSCISEKEGSVFTSVNTKKCHSVPLKKAEQDEIAKGVEAVFVCKGMKAYKLYIVDDGTRSWYVLKHVKKGITSFEQDIVYKQNILGDFPNVGGTGDVEWILNAEGVPSGLIFSVSSQLNDKETGRFKTVSRYFAVKLDEISPLMVGVAKTQKAVKELLKAPQ